MEYVQHDEIRTVEVAPATVRTLSNGCKIVCYFWQGAEVATVLLANQLAENDAQNPHVSP
jgi:hypothetical protein